jgi:hypothetical protein
MADDEGPDDQKIAKWTFLTTALIAVLFGASIFIFILYR